MHCFKMGLKMFKWVQGGSVLQSYFEVSPKLLGFGACPGVLKVMLWCGITALRNLATSVSMIGFALRLCSWSRMLAAKIHADGSACSSPVRLDHLFFTGRFCLQCFVSPPSAVFSYVQTTNKPC